ncbi:MAG: ATP-dependent helicase [Methanoregulaceae archaeon]
MQLNPTQDEAVTTSGIQLILAGPGSGKTRVITEKVVHLIESGVNPAAILALTFSEKAAQEMVDRIAEKTTGAEVAVHTFHSFCLQVLRDHVLDSGIAMHAGVISSANQLVWGLRNIDTFGLETIEVGNNAAGVIEAMLEGISAFRDEAITPDDLSAYLDARSAENVQDETGRLRDLLAVYRAYEQYKRAEHLIDYPDMVHEAVRLLEKKPRIRDEYRSQYTHVLVDEFQDTNYVQLLLIKLLAGDHLCVVGDDDQTIYRFRGAYLTNLNDFKTTWQGCCETLLDRNYRSTSTILALALELMSAAPNRIPKAIGTDNSAGEPVVLARCANEAAEVAFIRDEISHLLETEFLPRKENDHRKFQYRDIAILCRRRAQGVALARALSQEGIPCTFRGEVELFKLPEIRNVMAWLRVVDNPVGNGISLYRLMRSAGIGEVAVQRLHAGARRFRDRDLGDDGVLTAMRHAEELVPFEAPFIAELVASIDRLIGDKETLSLPQLTHAIMMHGAGMYLVAIEKTDPQAITALNTFYGIATEYDAITRNADLSGFLEYLTVMAAFRVEVETEDEENAVQIMTVHKSKGTEYPAVIISDLSERRFPLTFRSKEFVVPEDLARGLRTGDDEKELFLQEERRLMYVAMTRAEERLYLTQIRQHGSNKRETKPSIFLRELDVDKNPLIRTFEVESGSDTELIAGEVQNPLETRRQTAIRHLTHAAVEARYSKAFYHLIELERLRVLAGGGDPTTFDPASYLSIQLPPAEIQLWESGTRPFEIPKTFTFSASSIGCYDTCPLKFKFEYLLEIPTPPKTYFGLGTAVHATVELLSKDRQKGIDRSRDEAIAILQASWDSSAYTSNKQEDEYWNKALGLLDNYFAWEAANENTVVEVERRFSFSYGDHPMRGKIDRLERRPDGRLVVVDFKTGSTSSAPSRNSVREEIQLNLYALAIFEEFGELPAEAAYLYLKETKYIPYAPTPETVTTFRSRLDEMIGNVLAGKFPSRPSYDCKWCDYREICELHPDECKLSEPRVH